MEARFDGNSELVAELVTLNGFKSAYAIKDGAEGPRGWVVIIFLFLFLFFIFIIILSFSMFVNTLAHIFWNSAE